MTLTRRHGFFDVLSDAFANDETVSKLDYGDNAPAAAAQPPREASVDGLWRVEMIVVGVPTKDPSSDLFGPKQRVTQENRGIGGESVEATLRLTNGAVEVVESSAPLLVAAPGAYRYQDGKLRIRLEAAGFTRTFTTKGTLQSIYGGDDTARTSSVYAIPPGPSRPGGPRRRAAVDGRALRAQGAAPLPDDRGAVWGRDKISPAGSFTAKARSDPAVAATRRLKFLVVFNACPKTFRNHLPGGRMFRTWRKRGRTRFVQTHVSLHQDGGGAFLFGTAGAAGRTQGAVEMLAVEDRCRAEPWWSPRGPTTWRWMRLIQCERLRFGGAAASRSVLISGLVCATSRDRGVTLTPRAQEDNEPRRRYHHSTRLLKYPANWFDPRSNRNCATSTFPCRQAHCSGVAIPSHVRPKMFAPRSNNSRTTST